MKKYGKKLIIMSKEHIQFIKKNKRYSFLIILSQIFLLIFFLILWEFVSCNNIVDSFIISSPSKIVKTICNLISSKTLISNVAITLYETILSFVIGSAIGIFIASLMWFSKSFAQIIDPYLTIINSLPKVALGPIIIIWAGAGMNSIIIMALLISTIITIINVYQGYISTDLIKIKLMKTFNANKVQIFKELIVPSSIPTIISTLKINISMSLIGIIMGEFLVSKEGIGYLILYGSQVFNLDLVMTGIFILCIISTVMYYFITYIENKITKNK